MRPGAGWRAWASKYYSGAALKALMTQVSWSTESAFSARRSSGLPELLHPPAARWLGAEPDRAGRVRVEKDLTVPGHPEIFVVGDTASLDQDGKALPGVAQVAMQQGRYAARR